MSLSREKTHLSHLRSNLFVMLKYLRSFHGSTGMIARHYTALCRRMIHSVPSEKDHGFTAQPSSRNPLLKPHLNYKYFAENADAIARNIQNRNFKGVDVHAVATLYAQQSVLV